MARTPSRSPLLAGATLALALLSLAPAARAQDDWVPLGQREVDFRAERDTIQVTAREGRFKRVLFAVEGNGVEIADITVHFGDGSKQDVQVREHIAAGSRSRAIDLQGEARVINRIELVYRTRGQRQGRATVRAFGKGTDDAGPGERWETLGERAVDFKAERDVIPVTAREGRFQKIRFEVEGNGVEILDITVHFGNGDSQDVQVREHIAAGSRSRVIELPGEARVINRVALVYRTRGVREGRATVKVAGLHAGAAAPAAGADRGGGERDAEGWELLGQRQVDHRAERDSIEVTAREGRFRQLRFRVLGNDIEVVDIKVHYGNGETQDVQVRERIAAGGVTRAIDLPGESRVIRRVDLVYRTRPRGDRATVRMFGK